MILHSKIISASSAKNRSNYFYNKNTNNKNNDEIVIPRHVIDAKTAKIRSDKFYDKNNEFNLINDKIFEATSEGKKKIVMYLEDKLEHDTEFRLSYLGFKIECRKVGTLELYKCTISWD